MKFKIQRERLNTYNLYTRKNQRVSFRVLQSIILLFKNQLSMLIFFILLTCFYSYQQKKICPHLKKMHSWSKLKLMLPQNNKLKEMQWASDQFTHLTVLSSHPPPFLNFLGKTRCPNAELMQFGITSGKRTVITKVDFV